MRNAVQRNFLLLVSALVCCPSLAGLDVETEKPVTKMRVVDRGADYFNAIPCADINKVVAQSTIEKSLLKKRKQHCVEKYKAFLPSPHNKKLN